MAGALSTVGSFKVPDEVKAFDFSANAGELAGAATYQPDDKALVSKQLGDLLSSDSPYIQRARTRAQQWANSRGLLNSSISAGAGEAAAIDAAMPIAQADAAAGMTALRDNTAAENTFRAASNDFGRQGALARYQGVLGMTGKGMDYELAQGDQQIRRDALEADTAYRNAQLGLSERQFATDTELRRGALSLERDRFGLSQQELALRESTAAAEQAVQQAQLQLQRDRLSADTSAQQQQLELAQRQLAATIADNAARLNLSREQLAAQVADNAARLGLSERQLAAQVQQASVDADLRRQQMGQAQQQIDQDARFRQEDVRLREGALALQARGQNDQTALQREQLSLQREQSAATVANQREQLAVERERLRQQASQGNQQAQQALAADIARIRSQATEARVRLETDPNLDAAGKAAAIRALGDKADADIAELVRFSGISLPDAWPSWINRLSPPGSAPAPSPTPAAPGGAASTFPGSSSLGRDPNSPYNPGGA